MNIFKSFFLIFIFLYANHLLAETPKIIAISQKQQQSMDIKVANIQIAPTHFSQKLPGEIVVPSAQQQIISAVQGGLVDSLNVAAGESVKKGQVLGHITSSDLLTTQREYLQAAIQQRLAKKTLDRDAALYKDGIIAERRFLATQSTLEEASAMRAQLKQSLKLGGMHDAAIAQLEKTGKYTSGISFTAPMAGVVLEQMVTLGQRVDMAAPLLKVGRLNTLWVEIHAPVELATTVRRGMLVNVPLQNVTGRVLAVIRSVNKADQTMLIRAEITENSEKLSPGQFVEVTLESTHDAAMPQANQFSVPKNAVIRQGLESYIFSQKAGGFNPVKITVISEANGQVMIVGDLTGNESVAVAGAVAIKAAWAAQSGAQ